MGGKLDTSCLSFAKGPRFLNMVMTFTLTPLSHYNSITSHVLIFFCLFWLSLLLHHIYSRCVSRYCHPWQANLSFGYHANPSTLINSHSFLSFLHHYGCHQCWLWPAKRDPTSTEAATSGDGWSCSFYCSTFFLGSFYLHSFLLRSWHHSWCDHGVATADACWF